MLFLKVNFSQFQTTPVNQFTNFCHTALSGQLPKQYQFTFCDKFMPTSSFFSVYSALTLLGHWYWLGLVYLGNHYNLNREFAS